eukprot:gb/GECG01009620.1/.p1 GENE.gb/GECG01009620.1/~~gb/GECG01009620.1/.p1  ORF type:complete len:1139 (+),score=132.97 gb/GECG01009620.1/:1-3417(+)
MTSTKATIGLKLESSDNRMPPSFQLAFEKKYFKAAKSFTEHLEQEGGELDATSKARVYCNRAWCYSKLGMHRKCLEDIDEALKLVPRNEIPQTIGLQIKVLHDQGRDQEARRVFQKSTRELEDSADFAAIEYLVSVIEQDPSSDNISTAVGQAADFPRGQQESTNGHLTTSGSSTSTTVGSGSLVDDAFNAIDRGSLSLSGAAHTSLNGRTSSSVDESRDRMSVEAAFKQLPDLPQEVYAKITEHDQLAMQRLSYALAVANKHVYNNEPAEAMKIYDLVLHVSPNLVDALIGASTAKARMGEVSEALKYATTATECTPENAIAFKLKAQLLSATGRHEGAIKDMTHAIKLSINRRDTPEQYRESVPDLLILRADIYNEMKKDKMALMDAVSAAKSVPRTHRAWLLVAKGLANLGKLAESHRLLNKLSLDMPGSTEVFSEWAHCMREYGHNEQVDRIFCQILDSEPQRTYYRIKYADFLYFSGCCEKAMTQYKKIYEQSSPLNEISHSYLMEATCFHSLGRLREAVKRYEEAFALNGDLPSLSHRDWAIYQAMYSTSSGHPCFSRKYLNGLVKDEEMPESVADVASEDSINFDALVPSSVKESHARRLSKNNIGQQVEISTAYPTLNYRDPPTGVSRDVLERVRARWATISLSTGPVALGNDKLYTHLRNVADSVGSFMQYESPGFLRNPRQHRQFGLAALEIAQTVRSHWLSLRGDEGLYCFNRCSSNMQSVKRLFPGEDFDNADVHPLCFRDVYDIALLWRQNSEPFDPVYWIEGLTESTFNRGFGLQTPMVSGFTEVPRYFPYCGRSLAITKLLMCEQYPMEDDLKQKILSARSANEVHDIMGRDFWVITPCYRRESLKNLEDYCKSGERDLATDPCIQNLPDTLSNEPETLSWLEGIKASNTVNSVVLPDVTEKKIRKGRGVYYRSQKYNMHHATTMALSDELGGQCVESKDLGAILQGTRLTIQKGEQEGVFFTIRMPLTPARMKEFEQELQSIWRDICDVMTKDVLGPEDVKRAKELFLSFYYYWVVLAPLTRGSSACGLCVFIGLSLAAGFDLNLPFPPGFQMDWEAILSTDPNSFMSRAESVVYSETQQEEHYLTAQSKSKTFRGEINPSTLPPVAELATTVEDIFSMIQG